MYAHNSIRYPYLVSPEPAVVVSSPDPLAAIGVFLEDVEMENAADDGVHVKYLALDTNILINHLHLVRQVYAVLLGLSPANHALLIPTAVINELDNLKLSLEPAGTTPQGEVTIGDLAKAATRWLLEMNQMQRRTHSSALRCQRWSERLDTALDKGDDKILDCCLYFKAKSDVILWTNDRNLALLAESNAVPAVGHQGIRLEAIVRALGLSIPLESLQAIRAAHPSTAILTDTPSEDEMELDDDCIPVPPTGPSLPTRSDPFRDPLTPSPPVSPRIDGIQNSTHSPSGPPSARSRQPISPPTLPRPLLDRLTTTLRPALTRLRPDLTTISDPVRLITTFRTTLLDYEHQIDRSSDLGMTLLRAVDALRTISTFLERNPNGRRVRTGQVADSVDNLADFLFDLSLPDVKDPLKALAAHIRAL